ncbi:hypothetical protein [Streptococcus suis]|uniref:hypothetical protein n=1 Tax=Streptococcus suis TaxID=1307 RepID=UPI000CF58FF8|nr:hypothetical protein [Streptococcus suis]
MKKKDKYIKPPVQKGKNIFEKITSVYKYLHPDYWKRKLIHLVFLVPILWMLYTLSISPFIVLAYPKTTNMADSLIGTILENIFYILPLVLTILSAFFYPFSLYWYRQSYIGRLLNSMMFLGSFWGVIQKIINITIGGILIAGFFSPITGYLLYRKCVRKNKIIGEVQDFEWG